MMMMMMIRQKILDTSEAQEDNGNEENTFTSKKWCFN